MARGARDACAANAIPLPARIALLAQVIDVFHSHAGREAAIDEAARRAGGWFDPGLVAAFERVAREHSFWTALSSPFLEARVVGLVPAGDDCAIDEDYLDAIAAAFGQVIDAKSPYTAGHSGRVAELSAMIAGHLDVPADRLRWLRRAAFLHDVGKLGVSNAILDKPAGLDTEEWAEMRAHAAHTREILGRIGVFVDLADIAAAHHERLDGTGYPLGLTAGQIARETRIITACDFYDALTSDRPYRAALPIDEALRIMSEEVGRSIDPQCFDGLRAALGA